MFSGGDGTQLGIQLLGVLVIALWSMTLNFAVFYTLKTNDWLRVPAADEIEGLDASYHGGSNYDENSAFNKPLGVTISAAAT